MARTRYTAIVDEVIELLYTFRKNFVPYDPDQWIKVEIYKGDPSDPNQESSLIQTINPANIIRLSEGNFKYIMNPVIEPGAYYDKQFLIPDPGQSEFQDCEVVQVQSEVFIPGQGLIQLTRIQGLAEPDTKIIAFLNKDGLYEDEHYVSVVEHSAVPDDQGVWFIDLPNTQNISSEHFYYVNVGETRFKVIVPLLPISNKLIDLPVPGDGFDELPEAPGNLAFSDIQQNQFDLSWLAGGTNQLIFRIYTNTVDTLPASPTKEVDAETLSATINSLDPNTQYYVWVRAVNQMGESPVLAGDITTLP